RRAVLRAGHLPRVGDGAERLRAEHGDTVRRRRVRAGRRDALRAALVSERVLIAGGGPVGMVTALALAQRGFPVAVFEAEAEANPAPRASTTHPATLELLASLGLADEAIRRGLTARTFQFRDRASGELVAEFDHAVLENDTRFPFAIQFEQHKL